MKYLILVITAATIMTGALRLNAQDYLITNRGDSIAGSIKPLLYGPEKRVQINADKGKEVFSIIQVRRYRYKDDIYEPVRSPDGYTFMKLVKSGYVSLYNYQLPNQVSFDGIYLNRRDGKGMDVPNISFKKSMKNFLQDCPDVVARIDAGEFTRKNLTEMLDLYNACIERHSSGGAPAPAPAVQNEQPESLTAWDALETKVKTAADFDGKPNALEMIQEIKGKVSRAEKIPNFLIEGLKGVLKDEQFTDALNAALNSQK